MQASDFAIISTPIDFVGINYYTRLVVQGAATQPLADQCQLVQSMPGASYTEMAWEIYPQGLRDFLVWVHREYALPQIYVTENGAAFADAWDGSEQVRDPARIDYLRAHIASMAEAREQNVPLKGYFLWSLMDNFEWAYGYSKRFGIVYIDYPTQRRIIKASGHWYAALLAAHREIYQP